MKNILFFSLLLAQCASYTYVEKTRQSGLTECMPINDECQVIKIDTVYNSLGGVVKVYSMRCKEKNK